MIILQEMGKEPLTADNLTLIMLRSVEGWDQVATYWDLASAGSTSVENAATPCLSV